MRKRFCSAWTAALITAGVGACAAPPPATPPQGTLSAGTAKVAINDRALPETSAVACMPMGSFTKITTGNTAAGITALVSNKTGLTAESVSINNLSGFTGAYMAGLAGKADITLQAQTYTIHGWAEGFDTENPSQRATSKFRIQIAC